MTGEETIDKLYDGLSRYQWWLRRASSFGVRARGARHMGLEMHKRLRAAAAPGFPGAGCAGLDDWLFRHLGVASDSRVLDIGCGFGATMLKFAEKGAAACTGLTISRYQSRMARREARQRGLDAVCSYRRQSFDDPIEGEFDRVVSIETLLHAPDMSRTLASIGRLVPEGGPIVLVEDMAIDDSVKGDALVRTLLARWSTEKLCSVADYRAALAGAGFAIDEELELTDQLEWPDPAFRDQRERRLRRLRRVAPFGRGVVDAFLGGIAMERLYAAGLLSYRTMLATRGAAR